MREVSRSAFTCTKLGSVLFLLIQFSFFGRVLFATSTMTVTNTSKSLQERQQSRMRTFYFLCMGNEKLPKSFQFFVIHRSYWMPVPFVCLLR